MVHGRAATFAASVAAAVVAVGGVSVWEMTRSGTTPELQAPTSAAGAASLAVRKVAAVAQHRGGGGALPQRPEPPEMRRIVQRMIFR